MDKAVSMLITHLKKNKKNKLILKTLLIKLNFLIIKTNHLNVLVIKNVFFYNYHFLNFKNIFFSIKLKKV